MKDRLLDKFSYIKCSGEIFSKKSMKVVGAKYRDAGGKEYLRVFFEGKRHRAHRLVMIMHGFNLSPDDQIDHINGNGLDNRIENLRIVDSLENAKNQKIFKNNKTGIHGVYFAKHAGKWCAQISNRKKIHLGYFNSFLDACAARKSAECKFGFHPNHGSVVSKKGLHN